MKEPIKVGDTIFHAYVNMTSGKLTVHKENPYTVSKVVPIEKDPQNVGYSDFNYHTEEGLIFGDMSCVSSS